MPLWGDPLDELIEDIERALPSGPRPLGLDMPPPFEDVQLAICPIVFGDEEEEARTANDPRVLAVWAYYERLAQRREAHEAADTENGDKTAPT